MALSLTSYDSNTSNPSLYTWTYTCMSCYSTPCCCTKTIWTSSSPVYLYQLQCPKCKKLNWGELDVTIECKKCNATLKAVSKKVDYEIAVD